MTLHVRVVSPDGGTLRDLTITAFPARIGRDAAAEIPIADDSFLMVSAKHAELHLGPSGVLLTPRSQKNLTLLNGLPVGKPTPVRPGDRIGLGTTGPTVVVVSVE